MDELTPVSEEIVSTFLALPHDQRAAYIGGLDFLTDAELAAMVSRSTDFGLDLWRRVSWRIMNDETLSDSRRDHGALLHGVVLRILDGDDPLTALRELAECDPNFYDKPDVEGAGE